MQTTPQRLLCSLWCITLACLGSSPAVAAQVGTGPSFKGPVGLQLYSLRDQFGKDVPGTLDEVKQWGIRYAELAGTYGLTPDAVQAQLADARHRTHRRPFLLRGIARQPRSRRAQGQGTGPQIRRLRLDSAPGRL